MSSKARGIAFYLLIALGIAWIPLVIQWLLGLRSLSDEATFVDYVVPRFHVE